MRADLQELKKRLKEKLPALVAQYLPNAKDTAAGWRIGDLQGNKGTSLFINKEGVFFDHNSGEKGTILDLATSFSGASDFSDTIKWACKETGYQPPEPLKRKAVAKPKRSKESLSTKALDLIEGRGLSPKFAQELPIRSLADDSGITFLHMQEDGDTCLMEKYYDFNTKRWTSSATPTHILWGMDYVTKEYENYTKYLIITEGHWDAIAYLQEGFPAVSIPSGVNNDKWIEESFQFLSSFENILLSYDDEEGDPGREGAARVAGRIAAILGPPRIISHPEGCKDANDTLKHSWGAGLQQGVDDAKPYAPPEILTGEELLAGAVAVVHDQPFWLETPLEGFDFQFRDHELTLYTGYTGHGKSNLLEQFIGYLMDTYEEKACVASFEDKPEMSTAKMLVHQFGKNGVADNPDVRRFLGKIHVYNTTRGGKDTNDPKQILDLFTHMHNRWGVTQFVIDNLMMLSVGKEDYQGQIELVELCRTFVNTLPVHLHLVAHPRKPPSGAKSGQGPDPYDISGASEIANLAWNILSLYRNIDKERQMALMLQMGGASRGNDEAVKIFDHEKPDAILDCHKQRTTGKLPTKHLWFSQSKKIYVTNPNDR